MRRDSTPLHYKRPNTHVNELFPKFRTADWIICNFPYHALVEKSRKHGQIIQAIKYSPALLLRPCDTLVNLWARHCLACLPSCRLGVANHSIFRFKCLGKTHLQWSGGRRSCRRSCRNGNAANMQMRSPSTRIRSIGESSNGDWVCVYLFLGLISPSPS